MISSCKNKRRLIKKTSCAVPLFCYALILNADSRSRLGDPHGCSSQTLIKTVSADPFLSVYDCFCYFFRSVVYRISIIRKSNSVKPCTCHHTLKKEESIPSSLKLFRFTFRHVDGVNGISDFQPSSHIRHPDVVISIQYFLSDQCCKFIIGIRSVF